LDGKFRKGENTVLQLGPRGTSWGRHPNNVMKFMMRGGSNPLLCKLYPFSKFAGYSRCKTGTPLPLEAVTSSGDSGTPAFIRVKGKLYLAGIDSAGDKTGATSLNVCGFGAVDEFTRVSQFSRFVHGVLSGRGTKYVTTMPIQAPGHNIAPFGHQNFKLKLKKKAKGHGNCRYLMASYWAFGYDSHIQQMCKAISGYSGKYLHFVQIAYAKVREMKRKGQDPSTMIFSLPGLRHYSGIGTMGWNTDFEGDAKLRNIHFVKKKGKAKGKSAAGKNTGKNKKGEAQGTTHGKKKGGKEGKKPGKGKAKGKNNGKTESRNKKNHKKKGGKKGRKSKNTMMQSGKIHVNRKDWIHPKHVKSVIDRIIGTAQASGWTKWKEMVAHHKSIKAIRRDVKKVVDRVADQGFAAEFADQKLAYPKLSLSSTRSQVESLKAHYLSEISRLSTLLQVGSE